MALFKPKNYESDNYDMPGMDSYGWARKEEGKTYKEIVLAAIEKCRVEGSKEMSEEVVVNVNGVQTTQNQREIYQNSVLTLSDLLLFFFDKDMREKSTKIFEEIASVDEKFLKLYLEQENNPKYRAMAERSNAIIAGEHSLVGKSVLNKQKDYVSLKYRQLFQELVLLFKRKNELSMKKVLGAY